jgi:choice-of-anchor B domain-containing protein
LLAAAFTVATACALLLPGRVAALNPPQGPLKCVGGLAGPYPCQAVDQASQVRLSELGGPSEVAGNVLGWHHEASGRELAVLDLRTKISFIEVTNPESPRVIGDYGTGLIMGGKAIYRNHLYVMTLQGGEGVLDILDLTRLLGAAGPSTHFDADATYTLDGYGSISIVQETGHAHLLISGQTQPLPAVTLDLSGDPESPVELTAWAPGPPYPANPECVLYHGPDTRFQSHEICAGAASRRSMVIWDMTDEVKLSRTFYKRYNAPWKVAFTDDHRYLLLADSHDEHNPGFNTRTFLFDLASLTAPVQFASYDGPTQGRDLHLEVRGRYAYLANASAGVRILDLRQIAKGRLREAGSFDVEPEVSGANWFGAYSLDVLPSGIVIVGSVRQGLYVLRPQLQP